MRDALLPRLRCPACSGPLTLIDAERAGPQETPEIRAGSLVCEANGAHRYSIDHGIVHFCAAFDDAAVQREIAYENSTYGGDPRLRDGAFIAGYPETGVAVFPHTKHFSEDFRGLLDRVRPSAGTWTLDVGTSACWTSRLLAARGGNVVALDVNAAEFYGLRAAELQFRAHGVYFDRVLESMTALPFRDGTFDHVVFHASLHHTPDLERTLAEAHRVLKPGGVVAMASEEFVSLRHRLMVREHHDSHEGSHHEVTYGELSRAARKRGFAVAYHLAPHVVTKLRGIGPRTVGALMARVVGGVSVLQQQFTSTQIMLHKA